MKVFSFCTYRTLRGIAVAFVHLFHPSIHVEGKENIPEGPVVICCNHSAASDPIYLLGKARLPEIVPIMAKQELMKIPVLGWLYQKLGAIPLDRSGSDLVAIKTAMKALREGKKLLIFPEGTRVRCKNGNCRRCGANSWTVIFQKDPFSSGGWLCPVCDSCGLSNGSFRTTKTNMQNSYEVI